MGGGGGGSLVSNVRKHLVRVRVGEGGGGGGGRGRRCGWEGEEVGWEGGEGGGGGTLVSRASTVHFLKSFTVCEIERETRRSCHENDVNVYTKIFKPPPLSFYH